MKIGTWAICENSPVRLGSASVEFERYLEDWIETEPNLLQSGIRIVARQLAVGAGIIDLLAIDSQGRWIVIEIKRGQLERKTIAQVIDYASCISTMPSDELIEKTNSYLNPQGNSIQSLLEERSAEDVIEPGNRDIELVVVGIGKIAGSNSVL